MSNMTQRDVFWTKIYELRKDNKDLIVIAADMGAPALDQFRRDFPFFHINVGIAEQNGILIASGLALMGKRAFCYAIAPFITLRCLEQIRVNCGIMNLPMTIVGVSAGFGYIDAGPTHHSTEDIAIMRTLPNMTVHSISDNRMAEYFAEKSMSLKGSNYVRLDRQPLPDLYDANSDFSKGVSVLKEGSIYLVGTGIMTHTALEVADKLKKKGIDLGVIDLYEFPIQEKHFLEAIKGASKLITMEEHYYPGGMGSAVCEVLQDNEVALPVKRIALPQSKGYCYRYGARNSLQEYFGVDVQSVLKTVEQAVSKNSFVNV